MGIEQYAEFTAAIRSIARDVGFAILPYGQLQFPSGIYQPLMLVRGSNLPLVAITAGFHGDEKAGPLSLVEHLESVAKTASRHGKGLVVFPCINPSGFIHDSRYNELDERPNNDFLRYVTKEGIKDDLGLETDFEEVWISSHPKFNVKLPKETRLMHNALAKIPIGQIVGAIDLHQDPYIRLPLTYSYVMEKGLYEDMEDSVGTFAPVARDRAIGSGQVSDSITNENGLIVRYDGSLTDYFHKRGVMHSVCVETTTDTPINDAMMINRLWMDIVIARSGKRGKSQVRYS